ncbi:hypothetical protein BC940DRAFT_304238 [Gongronella butleri]|nr:hypothetical protein BC940DRAFT_304238 [Gongronella butleri]
MKVLAVTITLAAMAGVTLACEQVCFYGAGDGQGYCDYWCQGDSGGHNSGTDYAYNFKDALGQGCTVEGSAETSVHCPGMTNCHSHSWWAGSDCP